MAARKILEAEVWCPTCKVFAGKVYRREIKDDHWEHVSEPKVMPKYCSMCEGVLERK